MALLLFSTLNVLHAEEELVIPNSISEEYNSGPYLIYNCLKQYWVCVSEENFKECQEERLQDITDSRARSKCAPVKKFVTEKSCFERQLYLVSQNYGDRICVLEQWRQKEI